jgi:hypothetical protein
MELKMCLRLWSLPVELDINEQLAREVDYLKAENQVLKDQLTRSGKCLRFTDKKAHSLVCA